jgi:1-phosphofructokinase
MSRDEQDDGHPRAAVAVLEPSLMLMVAIGSDAQGRAEVHFHAGGQGFWVARMVAELGARALLCAPLGGRSGDLLPVLAQRDGVTVDGVRSHRSNVVWISTGPDGEEATVVQTPPPPLDRHEVDRLYGAMLAAGLEAGVAVLTGLASPAIMPAEVYRRLAHDLTANGVVVVADLSHEPLARALDGGVAVLKMSDEELVERGWAAGRTRGEAVSGIERLRSMGAGAVVVSRGPEPLVADLGAGRLVEVLPPTLEELNPRGAGDATTGALAAALAMGARLEDALRLAAAAGAVNVTRRGLGTGERRAIEHIVDHVEVRPLARPDAGRASEPLERGGSHGADP